MGHAYPTGMISTYSGNMRIATEALRLESLCRPFHIGCFVLNISRSYNRNDKGLPQSCGARTEACGGENSRAVSDVNVGLLL